MAALAGLLRDDVVLEMPPLPAWFTGRAAVLTFVAEKILTTRGRFRMRPARRLRGPRLVYLGSRPHEAAADPLGASS